MDKATFGQQSDACVLTSLGGPSPDRITFNDYDKAGQLIGVWKAWGVTTQNGFPATLQQR